MANGSMHESSIKRRSNDKHLLPRKTCCYCQRPFTWRKKWARDWPNLKYCSDKCRALAKSAQPEQR
ncbi:DUF2256 domain-containing protein [Halothiobacillus sp.]|uniref:DUF2256 domain-containing protein n=1 Tax=Halothiobacillus sp. TaxID=1891311 RepID=UPI003456355D